MIRQIEMRTTLILFGIFVGCCIIVPLIYFRISIYHESKEVKVFASFNSLTYAAGMCDQYKAQHGTWPTSLHEALSDPWDKDGWGHEIIFVPYDVSIGYGAVVSYGRDDKPGGTGLDRDITIRYPLEDNLIWNKGQTNGLPNPLGFRWEFEPPGK